jgi:Sulfotransferase family
MTGSNAGGSCWSTDLAENRAKDFRRNTLLESLLSEIEVDLRPSEALLLLKYSDQPMQYPVVLVLGPLRSGTTLFMQWLANTGIVAYPTNLLSRFYYAPILGAKLQLLLTDPRYSFRNELVEFTRHVGYSSENGKTAGALAPNEFWYFWRRFLEHPSRDVWTDRELLESMDIDAMLTELAGMMDVFRKPLSFKGMLFNYNTRFLDTVFNKAIFIQIKRDPASNIESILSARKKQFGNIKQWYSFRIPEYPELKNLDPYEQAAGQVYHINKAIQEGLEGVVENKKMTVHYEEFCSNPKSVYSMLVSKLANYGYIVPDEYHLDTKFDVTRTDIIDPKVVSACRKYFT